MNHKKRKNKKKKKMSVSLILILFYILWNICYTININQKGKVERKNLKRNNCLPTKHFTKSQYSNFFISNRTKIKNNINKLHSTLNNSQKNKTILETFKNNGNEFLFTKFNINNEEVKFLIDLCSDKSFVFKKKDAFFNKYYNFKDTNDMKIKLKEIEVEKENNIKENNIKENNIKEQNLNFIDTIHFKFHSINITDTDKKIYINNKKIETNEILNMKTDQNIFSFYIITNEELNKQFDGIIGFDFCQNFNNFYVNSKNNTISFNEDQRYFNEENFYEVKLHDYNNNLKYINAQINGTPYKAFFDTATKYTLINSDEQIEKGDTEIKNLLKDIYKVKKKYISNFQILSNKKELIETNLKNVYITNFHFFEKEVVLIGLDFFQKKDFFFDLKKGMLYISKDTINEKKAITYTDNYIEKKENEKKNEKKNEIKINEALIEEETQKIYEKLKNKELSFLKITNDMEKDNIYLKDCKNTNDVIKRYATKLLYGSDILKKNVKNGKEEEFEIRYNEVINFFKNLNSDEKQNMLNKIINIIKKNKEHFEKASEVLEQFVKYEMDNNLYSLHKFKSCNVGKRNENAVNEEFKNLYEYYSNHPDFSFEILNDFKKELALKKINMSNFNDERQIIKKIAEERVYSGTGNFIGSNKNGKKHKGIKRNIIVKRYSNDDNNIHTQIIIRRNTIPIRNSGGEEEEEEEEEKQEGIESNQTDAYDNINRMEDLFPNSLFSGLLRNFFGTDGVDSVGSTNESNEQEIGGGGGGEEEGGRHLESGGNDLFSELNNLFGFGNIGNNMFRRKKRSVLGFKTNEQKTKNEEVNKAEKGIETIEKAIKEEKDVNIVYLLNKVEKLNDINLKNFILQSLKNQGVRRILVDAVKKGYDKTIEECKKGNDNKSIYLLQMLKQSGIF